MNFKTFAMKKNYLFITALIFVVFSFMSTITNAQIKVGIQAGITSSEMHANGVSTSSGTGIKIGIIGDFSISEKLLFGSGIGYSQKCVGGDYLNSKLNFIELPLNFKYLIPISENMHLIGLGGAYLGYALSATEDGESVEIDSDYRLDYGLDLGAGIKFSNFQLTTTYQLGLKKFNYGANLNTLSISLAYFF